ncbi:MAG: hypothetical protein IKE91_03270 [Clostridia bacterium]|nr:hypothetical protein [Clostridia bacterium]
MGIKDFFSKLKKGKDNPVVDGTSEKYKSYVESIDDNGLSKMLVESITPELVAKRAEYGSDQYEHPLNTIVSAADTEILVKRFFASINSNLYKKVCAFYDGTDPEGKINGDYQGTKAKTSNPDNGLPVTISIPLRGDLRGVYEAVHEITHAFDVKNGDTPTRMVLGEVAPQCMERLLDQFLHKMSDSELKEFGFNRDVLEDDIKTRRLSTFFSRFNNAESLEEFVRTYNNPKAERKHPNGNRNEDSRYMLAQIYSTNFEIYRGEEQIARLLTFIESVENDDFRGANRSLGMQIYRENDLQRKSYILNTISAVDKLVKQKPVVDSSQRAAKVTGEQDFIK